MQTVPSSEAFLLDLSPFPGRVLVRLMLGRFRELDLQSTTRHPWVQSGKGLPLRAWRKCLNAVPIQRSSSTAFFIERCRKQFKWTIRARAKAPNSEGVGSGVFRRCQSLVLMVSYMLTLSCTTDGSIDEET